MSTALGLAGALALTALVIGYAFWHDRLMWAGLVGLVACMALVGRHEG